MDRRTLWGLAAIATIISLLMLTGRDGPTGRVVTYAQPTSCAYDPHSDTTMLECACEPWVRTGRIAQDIRWSGRTVGLAGDWCAQRGRLCLGVCDEMPLALLSSGQINLPHGRVPLLSVDGKRTLR